MRVAQLGVRSSFWGETDIYNFQSFLGQKYFLNPVTISTASKTTAGSLIKDQTIMIIKDWIVCVEIKPFPFFMGLLF